MGWGWSDISILIKSDMLAKLLAEHGIKPKGAGNVKKGIRYDIDFECQNYSEQLVLIEGFHNKALIKIWGL